MNGASCRNSQALSLKVSQRVIARLWNMYRGEVATMGNDDYDYFAMSVRDSIGLILWSAFFTILIVGTMLAIAL